MKKAEDWAKDYWDIEILDDSFRPYWNSEIQKLKFIIQRVQEEAIEEAVKLCMENAETYEYTFADGCETCGHTSTYIDEQSILKCIEILKKEIE